MVAGLGSTWWQYLLLFFAVAASWAGVPLVGTAALGAAGVAASQGKLDLAAVIVVSVIAGEAGGLGGYVIGRRWGRRLLDRPGRHQAGRRKMMERGESLYARWGWLAVFFTPAIVSGTAQMPPTGSRCGTCWTPSGGRCRWRPVPTAWAGSPRATIPATMSPS